ncbi:MAG: hypothetical protein ACU826_12815, partial [Gammaproteobacteria bacterium]
VTNEETGTYVTIKTEKAEDEASRSLVNRELDRHFFLTAVRIRAEMIRSRVSRDVAMKWSIHGALPDTIQPQVWKKDDNLERQLKLWSLAKETDDLLLKVIYFYQIIELAHPKIKSRYLDFSKPPDAVAECKLLRDLVVHAGKVDYSNSENYCKYLDIDKQMLDLTKQKDRSLVMDKLKILESEAKNIIESKIFGLGG